MTGPFADAASDVADTTPNAWFRNGPVPGTMFAPTSHP
jgi:hypothetical protein